MQRAAAAGLFHLDGATEPRLLPRHPSAWLLWATLRSQRLQAPDLPTSCTVHVCSRLKTFRLPARLRLAAQASCQSSGLHSFQTYRSSTSTSTTFTWNRLAPQFPPPCLVPGPRRCAALASFRLLCRAVLCCVIERIAAAAYGQLHTRHLWLLMQRIRPNPPHPLFCRPQPASQASACSSSTLATTGCAP